MTHRNAPLAPEGRRRLCERVDAGRPICHVAAEAGIARGTLGKWHSRWREEGEAGLEDHSSRPQRCPNRTPIETEVRICELRRTHKVGPVQLVGLLAEEGIVMHASTVHRVLDRYGISQLRDLDVTGEQMREPVRRYEYAEPGQMIHIDVKKLGRIPPGGGWRVHGRGSKKHRLGETRRHRLARMREREATPAATTTDSADSSLTPGKPKKPGRPGYVYLHTALDDHSRLSYTEELHDETGQTAAGFWTRAAAYFAAHGINVLARVLSDNGACYRSKAFAHALDQSGTRHKFTRPYRPQTNGKVERYHRTLAREWAYRQAWESNEARTAGLAAFLHRYNYARPHTALGGKPPISRTPNADINLPR